MKKEKLRPNGFYWWIYKTASKIIGKIKAHYKFNKKSDFNLRDKSKGCIVLYNHACNIDHFISTAYFNRNKVNYVVTRRFDYEKAMHKVFSLVNAVVRDQFKADLPSILKMKKVIEQKGIICIAPAGQVTIHGGRPYIPPAIVKLLKMCKADVYTLQSYGTYLNFPKWSDEIHGYPVYVDCVKIISSDELKTASNDEIYERVVKSLDIDDRKYQKDRMIPLKKKHNLAVGLDNVFYECPYCGSKYHLKSIDNDVVCEECNKKITYNQYGYLETDGLGDFDETKWFNLQEETIYQGIKNLTYHLESKVKLFSNNEKENIIEEVGSGILKYDINQLVYQGTFRGKDIIKEFNMDNIIQFPFKPNVRFNIPDEECFYEFVPEKLKEVTEWSQIANALHRIRSEKDA